MIYPSSDRIDKEVDSRYALVVLAAKRARQIKEGARALISTDSANPLTVSLEEIAAGAIKYRFDETSLAGREAREEEKAVVGFRRRDGMASMDDPLAAPNDLLAQAARQLGAEQAAGVDEEELELDEEEEEEEEEVSVDDEVDATEV